MLRFASLGSGSKGNATIVEADDTRLLIDCGFSLTETKKRLTRLDCPPETINAILVTHEHGDHAKGVARLSRHYQIPVYATCGTYHATKDSDFASYQCINPHQAFVIQDIQVTPFPVPHDAREPCQFVFSYQGKKLALVTDFGAVTNCIIQHVEQVDALMLEFNYDEQLLAQGKYPLSLKHRVANNYGHLANHQAQYLLENIQHQRLQYIVAMHLSENNNKPEYVERILARCLEQSPHISRYVSCQQEGFDWFSVA